MRVRILPALWCALMTASSLAEAHQLALGIRQSARVESNIFGSATSPITDGTYRINPSLSLGGSFDRFRGGKYQASYRPSYLWYFRSEGVNNFDNKANGSATIDITRRDHLSASASYDEFSSVQAISQAGADGSFDVLASPAGETIRAFGDLAYSRSLNQRTNVRLSLDIQNYSYRQSREVLRSNVGNKSVGAVASYSRGLSDRLTLGASLASRYRLFDEQPLSGRSEVVVSNLGILGSYRISPRFVFDFQGGPSLISTAPGAVVGRPQPESNDDFTYFADISLTRKIRDSKFRLNYTRNEDASGGSSRTSVVDSISASFSSAADEFWRVDAVLGWSRRQTVDAFLIRDEGSTVPRPFSQETQLDRAWVSVGAARRLGERILLRLDFRYQSWTDYKIDGIDQSNQDNYSGSVSLNYEFPSYFF